MKNALLWLMVVTASMLFVSHASAEENTYSNSEFKFMMKYPENWKMKEDSDKMTSVCFAKKKCEIDNFVNKPQINLVMQDLKGTNTTSSKKYTSPEGIKTECDVIEKGKKTWAGKSSYFTTMRCPEKKYWRYTTTITMTRKRSKMYNRYALTCSMLSKSKDKAASVADYDKELKMLCEEAIASSRMLW
ncbi:MAG: hypothetical protein ABH871_08805 [Pseudomonadota bacterium]